MDKRQKVERIDDPMWPLTSPFFSFFSLAPKSEQVFVELIREDSEKSFCDIMLVIVVLPLTHTPENQKKA